MNERDYNSEIGEAVMGFLKALPALDPVIQEITGHAPIIMKLELKDPQLAAAVDLSKKPLQIRPDADEPGHIGMSGKVEDFHKALLGFLPVSVGINQRKLVARGSTAKLMQVVPLFYVTPYIYPFFLESIGQSKLIQNGRLPLSHADRPLEGIVNKFVSALAYVVGYALGFIKSKISPGLDIIAALESMGKGLRKAALSGK